MGTALLTGIDDEVFRKFLRDTAGDEGSTFVLGLLDCSRPDASKRKPAFTS